MDNTTASTEVKRTTVEEKGTTVNMNNGTANVPTPDGKVRVETVSQQKVILDDTPRNREALAQLFEKNGFHAEAAELRGKAYEPSLTNSAKNLITENTSLLKGMAIVAIGAFTYYVSRKALSFLAKKMGWNLFGNVVSAVPSDASAPSEPFRNGAARRTAPTQMSASA